MKKLVLLVLAGLFSASQASAQNTGQVTGQVTDGSGAPLSGVAVTVGTAGGQGTLTAQNGRYTIENVPAGTHQVRASRLGFGESTQSVTVAAGQAVTANFTLTESAVELEGVVAVGYGTQQRRDVTGAVSSVSAEEIKEIPASNAIEAIKGRVAGVDIISNGYQPGAGVRVRVRGTRSLEAGNDPLYVVDGIPVAGGLEDFNPADIQSIEVLKDASATAIYGSRGANGVVLITTNRGRAGDTQISYDGYYGVQGIRNKIDMMTGPEFAELKREAYRTSGKYTCPAGTPLSVGCAEGDAAIFTEEELAGIANGVSTDWQDLISRQGEQQNHQVSVNGGTENTRFSMSASYFDHIGVTKGTDYNRRVGSFSIDHDAGRLNVGIAGTLSNSVQNESFGDNSVWGQALAHSPLGSPYLADGTLNPQPVKDGLQWNPLLSLQNSVQEDTRTRFFGSLWAELELAEGVTVRSNFGPDLRYRRNGNFFGSNSGAHRASGNASASLFRDQQIAYTFSNFLNAEREFGEHRFNTTLLYEIQEEREDRTDDSVDQLPYEHQLWYNLDSAGNIQGVSSHLWEWQLQSFMGRLNYAFRDKYLLTLTGRSDGSSRLAPGKKYSFFPSVAVAWQLGEEPFMYNTGIFDELKLRASYGLTGNTSIDPYQTQGGLSRTVYTFDGDGAFGYRPGGLANPDLEWEKTRQVDVGVDFAVLGGRVTGAVDYYVQNTFDLLMERKLPYTSGFEEILENIGETRNTGLELALSTVNLDNWNGLRWTTDVAWTTSKNEIVSLYGGKEDDIGSRWFIGEPINVYYDYDMVGIWQLADAELAAQYKQKPGEIRVRDVNEDGRITGDDRVLLGRHERFPKWFGSLSNRFDWGNFDLSTLLTARWGYTLDSNFHDGNNTLFGRYNNFDTDYWTPENPSNVDPRPNGDQERPLYNSARQYKDGSHVRVRNITLGYRVPSSLVGRFGGEALRIYAQAQDPYIFTSYDGFDPESNNSGGTGAGSPAYRTLLIGASVGF